MPNTYTDSFEREREERIKIFKETKEYSQEMIHSITCKHTVIPDLTARKFKAGNIELIETDTVSALVNHRAGKTAILNMASFQHPGGSVWEGARAQEESLFRCSNLVHAISKEYYPLGYQDMLYTRNAVFFRDRQYNFMKEQICDVVTVAAIRLTAEPDQYYHVITNYKIELMLSVPAFYDVDTLILGAWGCGAFNNDPHVISEKMKLGLEKYGKYFEKVIFAVINDHNSRVNYAVFKERFGG